MKKPNSRPAAQFRRATPADARQLAEFIDMAGEGLPRWFWRQAARLPEDEWTVGEARARRETGGFSYRNAMLRIADGRPVAMLLAYRIEPQEIDYATLPEPARPLERLEQKAAGSFYVNGLAALPECRGKGYGTELLELARHIAAERSCGLLSIQVFASNDGARRLYERAGYVEVAREPMPRIPGLPEFGASILMMRLADGGT
ncbi:MAG: GNAT family N-acetyltransferase [Gammaproteobacteria bacterium]